jgi:prevent-host-death family protein
MKSVGIADLKASLSKHLSRVKAGEEIIITERGKPIARIQRLAGIGTFTPHMERLIAQGRVRPASRPIDVERFLAGRPEDPKGAILAALLAEREEGR